MKDNLTQLLDLICHIQATAVLSHLNVIKLEWLAPIGVAWLMARGDLRRITEACDQLPILVPQFKVRAKTPP